MSTSSGSGHLGDMGPTGGGTGGLPTDNGHAPQVLSLADREALIQAKKIEIEQVIDNHDDLVREAFQLERFRSLLLYDPKVAKEDRSPVFEEYKSKYDLIAKTSTAGPARKTRRALNERLESLKASSSAGPSQPSSPAKKSKLRRSVSTVFDETPIPTTSISAPVGGLSSRKKGKRKADNWEHDEPPDESVTGSISVTYSRKGKHRARSSRQKSEQHEFQAEMEDMDDSISATFRSPSPIKVRKGAKHHTSSIPFANGDSQPAGLTRPKKRHKKGLWPEGADGTALDDGLPYPNGVPVTTTTKRRSGRLAEPPPDSMGKAFKKRNGHDEHQHNERPTVGGKTVAGKTVASSTPGGAIGGEKHKADGDPSSWMPRIKRVKLTLRRPPIKISHPAQRPGRAKFGNSLHALLSSYIMIDGVEYDEAALAAKVEKEARIRDKIDQVKSEGRLLLDAQSALNLLGIDDNGLGHSNGAAALTPAKEKSSDLWASVVDAAILRRKVVKGPLGPHVAGQVASRIKGYWEGIAMKEDKARAHEEKRLRTLAKATMKLVIAEWKKAIFHIREQERLQKEAEEKRLGRQHLDAILNQSGQILEAQQMDLARDVTRSQSRASSISTSNLAAWPGQYSEDDSEGEQEEDSEDGGSDESGSDDVRSDVGGVDVDEQADAIQRRYRDAMRDDGEQDEEEDDSRHRSEDEINLEHTRQQQSDSDEEDDSRGVDLDLQLKADDEEEEDEMASEHGDREPSEAGELVDEDIEDQSVSYLKASLDFQADRKGTPSSGTDMDIEDSDVASPSPAVQTPLDTLDASPTAADSADAIDELEYYDPPEKLTTSTVNGTKDISRDVDIMSVGGRVALSEEPQDMDISMSPESVMDEYRAEKAVHWHSDVTPETKDTSTALENSVVEGASIDTVEGIATGIGHEDRNLSQPDLPPVLDTLKINGTLPDERSPPDHRLSTPSIDLDPETVRANDQRRPQASSTPPGDSTLVDDERVMAFDPEIDDDARSALAPEMGKEMEGVTTLFDDNAAVERMDAEGDDDVANAEVVGVSEKQEEEEEAEEEEEEEEEKAEEEEKDGEEDGTRDDSSKPVDTAGEEETEETPIHDPEPEEPEWEPPAYLKSYAVARVDWDPDAKVLPPLLLRGSLRPYQQSGLEWLASLHSNNLNGILADEMGLGKTIQTIALLAHLACDRGIWGPHLIIVPTSVLLNWIMEFKKFLPGFRILSYHGSTKRRKELRQGWNNRQAFNVCVTSYTLASRDAHIFKRKAWYYMILDEAHMIKNFKSQRWNILLMFRSFRRLLLTGTPLQNNLTELWALLQFLMSGTNFANLKEFGEWFSNPLEKAIEQGTVMDEETQRRVTKLHTVLRPYLLRRLKRDVEKELPSKYEHLVLCRLSKRQRFLYDEFMARAETRADLQSGVYQKVANILMQLRKVCNHPDLFEVRPIKTSFAMTRAAVADFEIKELLVRRRLLAVEDHGASSVSLDALNLRFVKDCNTSLIAARDANMLDASFSSTFVPLHPGSPPPHDTRTIAGFRAYSAHRAQEAIYNRRTHLAYLNRLRCSRTPLYARETIELVSRMYMPLVPLHDDDTTTLGRYDGRRLGSRAVKSFSVRAKEMTPLVDRFAFATSPVVAMDVPRLALSSAEEEVHSYAGDIPFDGILHQSAVKLQIAFPDASLLQYDCGKLQELASLLRMRYAGGHRVLIFTQMTKILDILEAFLNFHGYLYLRLDGATKIEDRQYITERFNADARVFAFIASSRSGGVGINLTGADTVIFYDSDFNPQMDRQCEDRAHRIGQIRDVHIYRFVSAHTVEEAMLRKANQKRSLDDLVIQQGEFDWRTVLQPITANSRNAAEVGLEALERALGEVEDAEDAHAARVAASEEAALEGEDRADFMDGDLASGAAADAPPPEGADAEQDGAEAEQGEEEEEGGTTVDFMLTFVRRDWEFFREWRL